MSWSLAEAAAEMAAAISIISAAAAIISAIIAGGVALWTARSSRKAAKELAEQQAGYTRQIEALKNRLAFETARKMKFAEKELEILAECWKRIAALRLAAIQIETHGISYFRDCYAENNVLAELAELTPAQCQENLKIHSELSEQEREFIAQQEPKSRGLYFSYYKLLAYKEKYRQRRGEFSVYFLDNKIFLSRAMQADFQNVQNACVPIDERAEQLMIVFSKEKPVSQCLESLNKQLPPLMESMHNKFWQLERAVANHLFPEEAEKEQNGG